jgi:Xaa-Pro aminopeptidase
VGWSTSGCCAARPSRWSSATPRRSSSPTASVTWSAWACATPAATWPGHRDDPTSRYLRVDLPLRPGYTVTIEPGVYFIPALLDDPENRERYRDAVDWQLADRMREFGGIRIEDNVLVTEAEPEVLTAAIEKRL